MADTNVEIGLGGFPFEGGAGGLKARLIDHDGPASYTTAGETITAASLGFKTICFVIAMASLAGTRYLHPYIVAKGVNPTSFKLLWTVVSTGAEVANAVDLSADSCKLLVVGL